MKYLLLILQLVLISCGGSEKEYDYSLPDFHEYTIDEDSFKLECNTDDCPSFASLLLIGGNAQCSGTLINKKFVLTNSHCLEKKYSINSDCSDVKSYFIDKSGETVKYKCKEIKVLHHLKKGSNIEDYALIELAKAPVGIDSVNISDITSIPRDRGTVHIYTTNILSDSTGIIRKRECLNRYESVFNPSTKNTRSPLMALGYCDAISGNSGSGILNTKNELVGLLYGGRNKDVQKGIDDNFSFPNMFGLGLQTACLNLYPYIPALDYSRCLDRTEKDQDLSLEMYMNLKSKGNTALIKKMFKGFINDSAVTWGIGTMSDRAIDDLLASGDEEEQGKLLEPTCVHSFTDGLDYKIPLYLPRSPKTAIMFKLDEALDLSYKITDNFKADTSTTNIKVESDSTSTAKVEFFSNESSVTPLVAFPNTPYCN